MFEILAAAIVCQGKQQNQKCSVTNCMATLPDSVFYIVKWIWNKYWNIEM